MQIVCEVHTAHLNCISRPFRIYISWLAIVLLVTDSPICPGSVCTWFHDALLVSEVVEQLNGVYSALWFGRSVFRLVTKIGTATARPITNGKYITTCALNFNLWISAVTIEFSFVKVVLHSCLQTRGRQAGQSGFNLALIIFRRNVVLLKE